MSAPSTAFRQCFGAFVCACCVLFVGGCGDESEDQSENTTTSEAVVAQPEDESTVDAHDHDHGHDHDHSTSNSTEWDADPDAADQTIAIEVIDGKPAEGYERAQIELGSIIALEVSSNQPEEIHVHGYDILRAVSDGHPAHFAFEAGIPGVFEVELEASGQLLLLLEIS